MQIKTAEDAELMKFARRGREDMAKGDFLNAEQSFNAASDEAFRLGHMLRGRELRKLAVKAARAFVALANEGSN